MQLATHIQNVTLIIKFYTFYYYRFTNPLIDIFFTFSFLYIENHLTRLEVYDLNKIQLRTPAWLYNLSSCQLTTCILFQRCT